MGRPVDTCSALSKCLSQTLADFEPYWDPSLRRNTKLYRKFLLMLDKAGYLTYTLNPKGYCGRSL